MYPSLLYNRGLGACSTSSHLHLLHVVVVVPTFALASPSSSHRTIVVALVRPSRTHPRFHPIRYHVSHISLLLFPMLMHSSAQVPLLHRRAPTELLSDILRLATGCILVCATATAGCRGRTDGVWQWSGVFGREWLDLAHLSGMYPGLATL